MKFLVDDRERKVLNSLLESNGIECEVQRLKTGDYISNEICIERKTIDDFCSSILDGRLKKQVERMKEEFKHCFILISGSICERKSNIKERSVLGQIVSLIIRHKINIIMVDNDEQMAFAITRIIERLNNNK